MATPCHTPMTKREKRLFLHIAWRVWIGLGSANQLEVIFARFLLDVSPSSNKDIWESSSHYEPVQVHIVNKYRCSNLKVLPSRLVYPVGGSPLLCLMFRRLTASHQLWNCEWAFTDRPERASNYDQNKVDTKPQAQSNFDVTSFRRKQIS
jgi:hypothetical protein